MTVTIPVGSTAEDIASILKKQDVIKSDWAFKQYVRNSNASDDLKAGTYELSPRQSVSEIVSILTNGKIASTLLTILPGQRLDQIRQTFINNGFSANSVDEALNPALYKDHPALVDKPTKASLEGYLYPESFQKGTDPQLIIRKSLDEMQQRLTPDIRNAIANHGLSVHQGIILASIIEKEADKQDDRNKIAQVFYKRLKKGMKLQSDVTAFYGALIAHKPPSVNYNSPFNTYFVDGLPAGPISSITESSLEAAANPSNTDYLYFVAGDDGTVHFSKTAAEHAANVAKYCQKQC